jgi:hypothetical protein
VQIKTTLWASDGDIKEAAEYLGLRPDQVTTAIAYYSALELGRTVVTDNVRDFVPPARTLACQPRDACGIAPRQLAALSAG